jgi:hypothetical protein
MVRIIYRREYRDQLRECNLRVFSVESGKDSTFSMIQACVIIIIIIIVVIISIIVYYY